MNRELFWVISSQLCLHGAMAGMRLAAPLLALKQGYSPVAVGLLLALFSLTQVFIGLPAGRYADRHGLHRPIFLAALASVVGMLLAAVWPVMGSLAAAALLSGGASGVAIIAVQRHVGRNAGGPEDLRRRFSWLAIGPSISNFIGPFGAGLLIDYAGPQPGSLQGYQTTFFALALLPIASAWLVSRVARSAERVVAPAPANQRAWDLLREPSFRRLLLVNWFLSSCWDVHTFMVPLLGVERGISASAIGAILGAFALAATALRLVLPALAGRLTEWKVIAVAMLVTGACLGVYPWLQTPLAMGAVSVLLGFALGSVQPMVMSMLHQITPEARHGEAIGMRLIAINGSSVAMPLLFGSVGTLVGVSAVFWCTGLAVALGARLAVQLRHARAHATDDEPAHSKSGQA